MILRLSQRDPLFNYLLIEEKNPQKRFRRWGKFLSFFLFYIIATHIILKVDIAIITSCFLSSLIWNLLAIFLHTAIELFSNKWTFFSKKKTANFSHEKCSWKNTRKSNSERLIKATHKVIKGEGISHFFATLQEKCRFVTLNCVTCCKKVYRSLINFLLLLLAANISFLVLKFSRKTFSLLLLQWESFKNKKNSNYGFSQ